MYLLHQLLERSAVTHGTRTAVVDGERRITYAELEARANQLAQLCSGEEGDLFDGLEWRRLLTA